jgi:peptide/nickel transport system substrate-binding protein
MALAAGMAHAQTTLRVGSSSDIQVVDPVFTTAHPTRDHAYLIYDTLFGVDSEFTVRPQMLESWTVADDGMSISFVLREGLAFHDGAPVTSDDVIASIQRWSKVDSMAQIAFGNVTGFEATDARSFVMTLAVPSTLVIDAMAKPSGSVLFIMPKRIADTPHTEQIFDTVGSGPFTFDRAEWIPGQIRVYRANPDYVPRSDEQDNMAGAKNPAVDVVEFLITPDDATRQAALLAGEVDYLSNVAHDLVGALRDDPGLVVHTRDVRGEQLWLRPNHLFPPFDNKLVRQAVLYALNQEEHMSAVIADKSLYNICYSMYGCGTEFETEVGSEPLKAKDFDRARALLAEAGYNNERVVLLDTTNHPLLHGASLRTAETLRSIGMNVELQGIAVATLHQRRVIKAPVDNGGWSAFHTTFDSVTLFNPIINPALNASCDADNWPGWPCVEEIQTLRRAFAETASSEEKARIAEEVQRIAFEEVTHIPLGVFYKVDAWSNRLSNVQDASAQVFWGITKSE